MGDVILLFLEGFFFALSFRPDCDRGTVIGLHKIRACVFKPDNKDYYQMVVISSFHSYFSENTVIRVSSAQIFSLIVNYLP